jgi:E3 ubiquitin-protein ligase NEDD4
MFLLHQTIEQLQQQGEFKVECRRGSIFSDSYEQIIHAPLLHLHQRLVVSFIGEEGLDYGGISRWPSGALTIIIFFPTACYLANGFSFYRMNL